VGLVGGLIAGAYWLVLAQLLQLFGLVKGWWVVPLMGGAGLLAGLIIHRLGDPGEMSLLVNNIRFRGGRLQPRNNPAMILSSLLALRVGVAPAPKRRWCRSRAPQLRGWPRSCACAAKACAP
jgi:hypothetical protein